MEDSGLLEWASILSLTLYTLVYEEFYNIIYLFILKNKFFQTHMLLGLLFYLNFTSDW